MGKVIGWLMERGGRYHFSYDPGWVYTECPIPLDLEMLPIQSGVWESEGLSFNGPLALFDRLQPGPFAESTCFKWLYEEAKKLGSSPLESMPSTPLARLTWMSHLKSFEPDAWGIFFDPSAPYPEGPAKMWLPDSVISSDRATGWQGLQRHIQPRTTPLQTNWSSLQIRGDGQVNVERQFYPHIAPLPGKSIRLRVLSGSQQFIFRVGVSVNSVRAIRQKVAYLDLAERCGIHTAVRRLLGQGVVPGVEGSGRDLLYLDAITFRRGEQRLAENGLVEWDPPLNELGPLPYAVAAIDQTVIENNDKGKDVCPTEWVADSEDVDLFRKGPPLRQVVRLYHLAIQQGHEFDVLEACRRLIFAAFTGSLLGDDSPILLKGQQVRKEDGKSVVRWTFAPLAHISPMMMPVRSKQAAMQEVVEFIEGYIQGLGLTKTSSIYLQCRDQVLHGMGMWDEIAKGLSLNEWENGGILPMCSCDEIRSNKRGRKPRKSNIPTPDYLAAAEQLATGNHGESNELSNA